MSLFGKIAGAALGVAGVGGAAGAPSGPSNATSGGSGSAKGGAQNAGGLNSPIVFGGFKSNGDVGGFTTTPATLLKIGGAVVGLFVIGWLIKKATHHGK